MWNTNRRTFLSGAIAAGAGSAAVSTSSAAEAGDFKLGVASFSFREFSRAFAIRMLRELKVTHLSVKEFHLLYRSTPEEIAKAVQDFEKGGITVLSGGVISMQKDDEGDLRRYFDYARAARMPMMIIAPTHATMPKIEKLVKEYDIRVAIHNHGPEDKHFPAPKDALEVAKNMDPRVGLCIDVGHTRRTGTDPVQAIAEAGSRLLDVHIKDIKFTTGKNIGSVVGEGVLSIPAIFKQLLKMNYTAGVMLEYEIDGDNPVPGMQRSFSYMRGVLAGLKAA